LDNPELADELEEKIMEAFQGGAGEELQRKAASSKKKEPTNEEEIAESEPSDPEELDLDLDDDEFSIDEDL
ncbi:MAG: hypothetical protein K2K36_09505, partial [Muribaculaceae bacterium]|nr:hypothetical protein [Muribaculaceae bacterium]